MNGGRKTGIRSGWGAVLLLGALSTPAAAQSVGPVIVEHRGRAESTFEVRNDTLFPFYVTLEAKSFSITESGQALFRPIDPGIRLRISTMSFRVPPRQSYQVSYEADADSLPAWFVIYSTFARAPDEGVNIQVELPHTVYLLQPDPLRGEDIRVSLGESDPVNRRASVILENRSDRLGRVQGVVLTGRGLKQTLAGFPLLPGSRRRLDFGWDVEAHPEAIRLDFKGFDRTVTLQELQVDADAAAQPPPHEP